MDIAAIVQRTGIPTRRLRYVLDHGVLPVGKQVSKGRGAVRSFTDFEAFGLTCAALMLEAGLRRSLVRGCMDLLCGRYGRGTPVHQIPFYQAFQSRGAVSLEIGDGVNVRLHEPVGQGPLLDTGWRQAETGAALQDGYEPLVLVRINVGSLKKLLTD